MPECLFCDMAQGKKAVDKLYEDELVFSIRDIHPRAPVHFMVIPKEHIPTAADIREEHGALLAHMFSTAARVARQEGILDSGYRIAFNVGRASGMTIYHLHMHVLGGRTLGAEG